jgi:hypothetical protein
VGCDFLVLLHLLRFARLVGVTSSGVYQLLKWAGLYIPHTCALGLIWSEFFFPSWVTWGRRYVIFYFCGISDNKGNHMPNWSDLTPMYHTDIHLMYTTVSWKRRRFSYASFGGNVLGSTFMYFIIQKNHENSACMYVWSSSSSVALQSTTTLG